MESITYVAEATALNEGVHNLKQWIYEGRAHLLIPTCTLHAVEAAYKSSIAPKDAPKAKAAKPTGRTSREERPLFDINPRTVWELLERARSENAVAGITFQQEKEVFTQWRDEEEKATAKAETPLLPPSSFADALLRKLTMKEEKEEIKAPAKPKLTVRAKESKPVWKIDKVPVLSSAGLSDTAKTIFSCILWKVYEAEKNPLQPVKYILLVNDKKVGEQAKKLGIVTANMAEVRAKITQDKLAQDERNTSGQLEQQFPEVLAMAQALAKSAGDAIDDTSGDFGFLAAPQTNGHPSDQHHEEHQLSLSNDIIDQLLKPSSDQVADTKVKSIEDAAQIVDEAAAVMPESQHNDMVSSPKRIVASKTEKNDTDSELDSDEEIIVFNPRNRRTSGLPQGSIRSRPGTAGGFTPKIYKSGTPTSSRPTSSIGMISLDAQIQSVLNDDGRDLLPSSLMESIEAFEDHVPNDAGLRSPSSSKLKAQSPVFTPGQPFMPSPLGAPSTPAIQGSPVMAHATPPTGPRNAIPRHARGGMLHRDSSQEQLRLQKESQRIIQRQREAIMRQAKVAEANLKSNEKPSPRLVQMEPTNNPTVIDPDAYDRSYVVQPPTKTITPQHTGDKRRPRGGRQERNALRDSPKRAPHQPNEPDVDFVLKSGAPRGSTRGRGRLWVP